MSSKRAKDCAKIPDSELLAMASEFDLGPEPILNGMAFWYERFPEDTKLHRVSVKSTGNGRWAILKFGNFSLNKNGQWEYQPFPSYRDDKFLKRCRYKSVHEAIGYYRRWKEAVENWATQQLEQRFGGGPQQGKQAILEYCDIPSDLLKFRGSSGKGR
jgi:hypothetical protein